jgi:hypothetical protein
VLIDPDSRLSWSFAVVFCDTEKLLDITATRLRPYIFEKSEHDYINGALFGQQFPRSRQWVWRISRIDLHASAHRHPGVISVPGLGNASDVCHRGPAADF